MLGRKPGAGSCIPQRVVRNELNAGKLPRRSLEAEIGCELPGPPTPPSSSRCIAAGLEMKKRVRVQFVHQASKRHNCKAGISTYCRVLRTPAGVEIQHHNRCIQGPEIGLGRQGGVEAMSRRGRCIEPVEQCRIRREHVRRGRRRRGPRVLHLGGWIRGDRAGGSWLDRDVWTSPVADGEPDAEADERNACQASGDLPG